MTSPIAGLKSGELWGDKPWLHTARQIRGQTEATAAHRPYHAHPHPPDGANNLSPSSMTQSFRPP